ncbi:LacI family DNA-binding transcriptional regulator [Hephaestia sp. GCM10023244]|uniref:LacI family DNA-binding transcriptional regulator n=1 Tax=unclassified Hephaestia TaxID=2631281 RepID=UPI002077479B|nr:LacI family DNA-binding transcriptional regulator [Hephaestia sp. MAHUQ-44]MCM8731723.1 LacI family DNA-binding transcriptional regulator [Hephaestia sp. MAHUQ-44]
MGRSPRQSVTIRHVAAEAGVSLQTVSRVVNNEPNVRPQVRERVMEAVNKLGYVPSLAARRMGGSRSYLILALNDRDRTIEGWRLGQGSDWIDQMLYGGMLACAERGYRMIFELIDTHSAEVEREVNAALSSLRPDGVILTPPHSDNPAITDLLVKQGVPFARIGSNDASAGFAIRMDDGAAAEAATAHLIALGHRRIGFITGSAEYRLSGARTDGYRTAMAAAGLPIAAGLIQPGDFSFEAGDAAMRAYLALAEPVTAVIASSEQTVLGALDVARARGVAVPGDLSLVSFDDTPVVRFSVPPLTAITQPIAPMAAKAAELLIDAASGKESEPGVHVIPFALAVRRSSGPPRD